MDALEAAIKSIEVQVEDAARLGQTSIRVGVGYANRENMDKIVNHFKSKGFQSYKTKDTFDVYEESIAIEW